MSHVISFRLSEDNPREAKALAVLRSWLDEGYSVRHVMTEALTSLAEASCVSPDEEVKARIETLLSHLLDRLPIEGIMASPEKQPPITLSFRSAISRSARYGLTSEQE